MGVRCRPGGAGAKRWRACAGGGAGQRTRRHRVQADGRKVGSKAQRRRGRGQPDDATEEGGAGGRAREAYRRCSSPPAAAPRRRSRPPPCPHHRPRGPSLSACSGAARPGGPPSGAHPWVMKTSPSPWSASPPSTSCTRWKEASTVSSSPSTGPPPGARPSAGHSPIARAAASMLCARGLPWFCCWCCCCRVCGLAFAGGRQAKLARAMPTSVRASAASPRAHSLTLHIARWCAWRGDSELPRQRGTPAPAGDRSLQSTRARAPHPAAGPTMRSVHLLARWESLQRFGFGALAAAWAPPHCRSRPPPLPPPAQGVRALEGGGAGR